MATVYILYSHFLDSFYIGSCLDINQRLQEHNSKFYRGSYTSRTNDWEVFWYIENLSMSTARSITLHQRLSKGILMTNYYIWDLATHKTFEDKQTFYFVSFTCYRLLHLIDSSEPYDSYYKWFTYLMSILLYGHQRPLPHTSQIKGDVDGV